MRLVLRAATLTLIFAALSGPGDIGNWLVGGVTGLALAAITRSGPAPATPANPLRLLLLPWFLLGVGGRIAAGTWQMILLLLITRDWSRVGFVTCRAPARSEPGGNLLALVETASPGSIVSARDSNHITTSVVGADDPAAHCAGLHRWHARFQKPMLR